MHQYAGRAARPSLLTRPTSKSPSADRRNVVSKPSFTDTRRIRPANRPSAFHGRPEKSLEYEEETFEGVTASDKRRHRKEMESKLRRSAVYQKATEYLAKLMNHAKVISEMTKESINQAKENATLQGRLAHRLRWQLRSDFYFAVGRFIIKTGEKTCQNIEKTIYDRKWAHHFRSINQELEDIEDKGLALGKEVFNAARRRGSNLAWKAFATMVEVSELKDVRHQLDEDISSNSREIKECIDILISAVPFYQGRILGKLTEFADATLELIDQYGMAIDGIAHNIRVIKFNIHLAKHSPEITFATRWSTAIIGRYTWPLHDNANELDNVFHHSAFDCYTTHPIQGLSQCQRDRRDKFRELQLHTKDLVEKLRKICAIFLSIIGEGYNSLCPNPSPRLHDLQTRAFKPLERFDEGWAEMLQAIKLTIRVMNNRPPWESQSRTRKDFFELLRLTHDPPTHSNHPLSRRGNRQVRTEVRIWHSTRLLLENLAPASNASVNCMQSSTSDFAKSSSDHYRKRSKHSIDAARPDAWLTNNSLYPDGPQVPIHLVKSHTTLQQAVEMILTHTVVGIHAQPSDSRPLNIEQLRYVVIATMAGVYIFDCVLLAQVSRVIYNSAMKRVIENASILKIGMDMTMLSDTMWRKLNINLTNTYDLKRNIPTGQPPDLAAMIALLDRHRIRPGVGASTAKILHLQNVDLKGYTHNLALRAYAPLRLLERLHSDHNIVKSDFNVPFVLNNHYNMLRSHQPEEAQLGPVLYDEAKQTYISDQEVDFALDSSDIFRTGRKVWLKNMSIEIARQHLSLNSGKNHRSLVRFTRTSPSFEEVATASYFLATVFGQTLNDIETNLGLPKAAEYILWASKNIGLRLNQVDRRKYQDTVGLTDAELKHLYSLKTLSVPSTVADRFVVPQQPSYRPFRTQARSYWRNFVAEVQNGTYTSAPEPSHVEDPVSMDRNRETEAMLEAEEAMSTEEDQELDNTTQWKPFTTLQIKPNKHSRESRHGTVVGSNETTLSNNLASEVPFEWLDPASEEAATLLQDEHPRLEKLVANLDRVGYREG